MSAYASVIDLTALDGSDGFQINGEASYDKSGRTVSSAGDINGDGFADLVIGAPGTSARGNNTGSSYVIFGTASGFAPSLDLSDLDGSNGFQLNGQASGGFSGQSVTGAGDFNGDGITDLIIGAPGASPTNTNSGAAFILYGTTSGFDSSFNLATVDGNDGFRIDGHKAFDGLGWSVDSAGDFNGDGFGDVIVGAYGASPNGSQSGATYVIFGTTDTFKNDLEVKNLDGTNDFRIVGEASGDLSGRSVAGAGDINGDGFSDIVIGAQHASVNGTHTGAAYVVFGAASGFASSLELSDLDGTNGFKIDGVNGGDKTGISVASAGDVNGDGLGDIIIGASGADPHGGGSGAAYVVFGESTGFAPTIELSALDGTNGFKISGEAHGDAAGYSVASAGDFNGDGFGDIIIGAPYTTVNGHKYAGAAYVIFGSASGFGSNVDLSALDGSNGFKIDGAAAKDFTGFSVHSAGDLNGDGLTDLVVGAYGADPHGQQSGSSYVIFGSLPDSAVTRVGTNADNTIFGSDFADVLKGLGGFDTLYGEGGNDTLYGGSQGDHLYGGSGNDKLYGGKGIDVLYGNGGADSLFGGNASDQLFGNNGADKLHGGAGGDLLNGGNGDDMLWGGNGADTLDGGKGGDTLTGGAGDDTFVFKSAVETRPGIHRDHITDFTPGHDILDLSQLDATAGVTGDFIGTSSFSHTAGEIRYFHTGGHTVIAGDLTGNGGPDFRIELDTNVVLHLGDFIL